MLFVNILQTSHLKLKKLAILPKMTLKKHLKQIVINKNIFFYLNMSVKA